MMKLFVIFSTLLAVGELKVAYVQFPEWTYDMQGEWPLHFPKCLGMRQSPINIETHTAIETVPKKCLQWINYNDNQPNMTLTYSNRSVEVSASWEKIPTLRFGPLKNKYKLAQCHFHLSQKDYDGSEHCFNSFKRPLEIHCVHVKRCYNSLADAVASRDKEALAITARLFKISTEPYPGLDVVLNAIKAGQTATTTDFNLASFFGVATKKYYTYVGSLDIPKCNEVVRWIIFDEIFPVTCYQLAILRKLKFENKLIHPNYRLLQPVNKRPILYNQC